VAQNILIVEDDPDVAEALAWNLKREGFAVRKAADGPKALSEFETSPPDLIILDLMLPGLNGWQLFKAFRKDGEVPIIMLTARVEEADRVAGLEMGADDYVTKPFSMREIIARVRMVLRRAEARSEPEDAPLDAAGVQADPDRREVTADGQTVELSPREFDLLVYFMRHAGRVRSREDIIAAVWHEEEYLDQRTVDVHVRWLRQKIEANPAEPQRILTVRGVGYKFAGGQ
jgi:DNA-binding response OmpR family regulator